MNSQPNEIITYILSYLDNYTLMFARITCHKWKHLIETKIFYKSIVPALYVCILTDDYYYFGKYYLNYNYDTEQFCLINDAMYYDNLVMILPNKKIFRNVISRKNKKMSMNRLLSYASYQGHLEVVKYLISVGADPHADNDEALRWSSYNDQLEVTKYLISMGVNLHADNDAALLWSAYKGHLDAVKYLISMGADLHVKNDYALRWSAEKGHIEVVKYLISMGANCHAKNDDALRWSAEKGHIEVVKYLINMGADLHVKNDYIFRFGAPNVIEYLKSISNKN